MLVARGSEFSGGGHPERVQNERPSEIRYIAQFLGSMEKKFNLSSSNKTRRRTSIQPPLPLGDVVQRTPSTSSLDDNSVRLLLLVVFTLV